MKEELYNEIKKIHSLNLPNPFSQDTELDKWNQWDIAVAELSNIATELQHLLNPHV